MPKRNRSDDEMDGFCQTKTYVNDKVLGERSSRSTEIMSKVYERTKELLWIGAQSTLTNQPDTRHDQRNKSTHPSTKNSDSNQLRITNGGKLVSGKEYSKKLSLECTGQACPTCMKHLDTNATSCHWCSVIICLHCSRMCDKCSATFCHLCSVLDYQQSDERSFCLQCKR